MSITVKNQQELDAALSGSETPIYIKCGRHDWLRVSVPKGRKVRVVAWDNSTVVAWDNSTVEARDNSTVVARDNSTVEAWDNSTVVARNNSTVEARGNSTVEARGNSTVVARHTARLALYGRATAKAAPLVSIHIHDPRARAEGGHHIIVPPIHTVREWADYHGLEIVDGELTVFKAVRADLKSKHGALYEIGTEVEAQDWRAVDECGRGLHFSATPREAMRYDSGATRFLACRIREDETVVIDQGERGQDKVKAAKCHVLHEVDITGKPLKVGGDS